jgi:hypothetical protein
MFAVFMTAAMDAEISNHVNCRCILLSSILGIGPYGWIQPLDTWNRSLHKAKQEYPNGTKFRFSSGSLDFSEDV